MYKPKGWKNNSMGHSAVRRGITLKTYGKKKIKPLSDVKQLPFNYEKAGYDINNLLLIPEFSEHKRHMRYHLQEYVEWLKGNSEFGEDVTMKIYFKEYRDPIAFDMETYDVENKTIIGWHPSGRKIEENFNPDNINHMSKIKNVVMTNAYGTYDLYGELIYTYEIRDMESPESSYKYFKDLFENRLALRVKDMKWMKIKSPYEIEEVTKS